jgi:hypothetical protein
VGAPPRADRSWPADDPADRLLLGAPCRLTIIAPHDMPPGAELRALPAATDERKTDRVLGSSAKTCSCGHAKQAHSHYRRGTDCALCGCARFHRPLLARLRALSR